MRPLVRCKAHSSRTGARCKAGAILGATVCRFHGGSAPQVKKAAARRLAAQLGEAIDPDRVLSELACVAYFDPIEMFEPDGALKPLAKWPEGARRAVAGIEVLRRNLTSGDGKTDEVLKVRLVAKDKALELLAQHHNLLKQPVVPIALTVQWKEVGGSGEKC